MPAGTLTRSVVLLVGGMNVAGVPANATAVAPRKFSPVNVTSVPTGPLVGVKSRTRAGMKKLASVVSVPLVVITLTGPVTAAAGTCAKILVWFVATNVVANTLLNRTDVEPSRFKPVMVTLVGGGPKLGVKLMIVGGTTKLLEVSVERTGFSSLILPVEANAGTVATICVEPLTVNVAGWLLNKTAVTPFKLVPRMTTFVPARPNEGTKFVGDGGR